MSCPYSPTHAKGEKIAKCAISINTYIILEDDYDSSSTTDIFLSTKCAALKTSKHCTFTPVHFWYRQ